MNLFVFFGVANKSMALMLADNRQFSAAFERFNGAPAEAQQIYRLFIRKQT
ncbi:hypothetical protein J7438_07400 [Thalassotalea sp. G20_0]|uniref:hypothetical protein n=1 Tax=Thalassotalea sp. G20_0 TaxID=2821093 RepID=UPI001ADC1DD8|nr:hypothetical protein [Thalassotalea sp. G20_0]MBO9493911.1 hypothetical protein [Thalassotalea sp. G20_0]